MDLVVGGLGGKLGSPIDPVVFGGGGGITAGLVGASIYGRGCWPAGCGSASTDELSGLSASDAGGRRCHDSGATDPRSVDHLLIS